MIPVLPDEIADLLDDATPARDAATDAEVATFLAEHTEAIRPEILAGWVKALGNHFAAGASRHHSTVSVTAGAMKEARAGYYPAQVVVDTIRPMFLEEVAKPPASGKQGAARHGKVAAEEFDDIVSWAVGQALDADLDEVRARVEKEVPGNVQFVDAIIAGNSQATGNSQTGTDADEPLKHSGHLGMAIKLAAQHAGRLIYVDGIGWHHWDGKRWARCGGEAAARRALHAVIKRDRRIVKSLNLSTEEENKRLKQIARYETAPAITGILKEASVLEAFWAEVGELDADPYLINCANGTVDVRLMELRSHDPRDLITKVTRAACDPRAVAGTVWHAFLGKVLPDKAIREYLRRVIGVALLGKVVEHSLTILKGKGRNGKGTFYQAVCFALGDYADMADPDLFMESSRSHAAADMVLLGLRLAVVSESGRGRALDEARVKRLTGGDIVSARALYESQISFQPSHLALFITNHLPKVSGDDDAIWARLRVVPFDVVISEAEQDKRLDEKLQLEADAILSWALAGLADYLARGERLDEPAGVLVATKKYRTDSDDVGRFLADGEWVLQADTLQATTSQLHAGYQRWAKQEGADEISLKAFGAALDEKGFPVTGRTNKGRWRAGLCLHPTLPSGDA